MSGNDPGAWKLLIYPLIIVFALSFILNLVVTPFVDSGIALETTQTPLQSTLYSIVATGNVFNITQISIPLLVTTLDIPIPNIFDVLGQTGKDFVYTQINIFSYLPIEISIPVIIIFLVCFAYVIWTIIWMIT